MLVYLYKYLREVFLFYYFAKERKAIEDKRKLAACLRYLRGDDNKEESTGTGDLVAHSQPPVEYNCIKNEGERESGNHWQSTNISHHFLGVITSLTESAGVINNKFAFSKITAKGEWSQMKVGRKLSFILFEGTVSNMKLHEMSWDETPEVVVIPDDKKAVGYNTELRTVVGSISEIADEILIIDTGNNQELYIPLAEHSDLKWFFMVGDVVSYDCVDLENGLIISVFF